MTSIKIVQFLRPFTPLSIYVQNSSTPLILERTNLHVNERNQNKNKTKSPHIQIDYAFYCSM